MFIDRNSDLWVYLPAELRGLIEDGEALIDRIYTENEREAVSDFSFMVFPFAKAYEGFLKKVFFDLGMISYEDYYGDEIRIGRILNPNYIKSKDNIFAKLCEHTKGTEELPHRLWEMWHKGRNQVFHYFPRNFRKLEYEEAVDIARDLVGAMEAAVEVCEIKIKHEG